MDVNLRDEDFKIVGFLRNETLQFDVTSVFQKEAINYQFSNQLNLILFGKLRLNKLVV